MPAEFVEVIGAIGALCRATQIKFVELDPEGIGHAQSFGDVPCRVALSGAGHAVVDLGQ